MRPVLAALLLTTAFLPAQINIAFHNGSTTVGGMTSRPDGTVAATSANTWNNPYNTGGQGLVFSAFPLLDQAGNATGATLAATSGYSGFNSNGWGAGTQDHVMMEGWYGFRGTESVVISKLPASFAEGYSVVIYGDSNNVGRTMHYTVGDGATSATRTIQDDGTFSGTFAEGANFAVFSGFTGLSLTITGNPGAADSRSAISGLVLLPGNLPVPPGISSFTADDHYVAPGASVTLGWQVTGADSLTLDPGKTDVTGTSTATVTPGTTTTYTLTATNADGSTTATLRVGAGPPRPNIVFFLVDDMGWQDTSEPFYYDSSNNPVVTPLNRRYRTPHMEVLADRGMKFTSAYAMPVCTPTRACWITGQNSVRHHVTNWTNPGGTDTDSNSTTTHNSPAHWAKGGLPASHPTLPALLQQAGYRTIHAGKAHFGATAYAREPRRLGFDVNIAGSEIGHPASYLADANFGTGSNHVPGLEAYHGSGLFLTEVLTLEMHKAIEQAVDDGTPFFAYLAHYAVHAPFTDDPRFTANYPALSGALRSYATMIEGMDKSLGDLLAKLDALGVAEDTLVVFMSDNGGDAPFADVNDSNAPLRHKKGSQYEGGIREPLIVSWAKRDAANEFQTALPIPAGSREDDLVAVFDLFPTFAAVAGATFTHAIDGHDLSPYLRADPGTHRPQELLIHFPHDHRTDYFTILREGDWKLIYQYASNRHELYNLARDIGEADDRSVAEPERVMAMSRKMARRLDGAGAQWPTFATGGADDPFAAPVLPAVDLDRDGLPDNTEDSNFNGLVDPGETDPDRANTDGDATPDGAELRTGTDPLDPGSFFRILKLEEDDTGRMLLTWPSASGALYRVESTTTLTAWSLVQDEVPADPVGPTTTFDAGLRPRDPAVFFRAMLK